MELTPVATRRTNKAERAIGTWKDHFIATLATVWEDFVEQAELTLNLMRVSPIHPSLSAWKALCGKFDVLATPRYEGACARRPREPRYTESWDSTALSMSQSLHG